MAEHPLSITVHPDHTTVTLSVSGEIDMATVGTLRACLIDLDDSYSTIVIDLSEVGFLDSSGLGLLAGTARRLEPEGRAVVLANPRRHVRKVIEVTGLDGLLQVLDHPGGAADAR